MLPMNSFPTPRAEERFMLFLPKPIGETMEGVGNSKGACAVEIQGAFIECYNGYVYTIVRGCTTL